jgi:hypothetical protein
LDEGTITAAIRPAASNSRMTVRQKRYARPSLMMNRPYRLYESVFALPVHVRRREVEKNGPRENGEPAGSSACLGASFRVCGLVKANTLAMSQYRARCPCHAPVTAAPSAGKWTFGSRAREISRENERERAYGTPHLPL